jgi:hypothetical protein
MDVRTADRAIWSTVALRMMTVKKYLFTNKAIFSHDVGPAWFTLQFCQHSLRDDYSFFLGAFAKLRKATVSFVLSVCLFAFVRMELLGCHWTGFHEIWYFSIFRKSVEKIQVSLKSDMNNGYFTWNPVSFMIMSGRIFFLAREVCKTKVVEKIKTNISSSVTFFPVPIMRWGGKIWCNQTDPRWQYNTAHALCMMDS